EATLLKFSNAVCTSLNDSVVKILECRIRAVNRHKNIFNFNAHWKHPVDNLGLHLQLMKRANGYKPWLYNLKIDVCQFLRKANNPFVSLVFSQFKEFSSFQHIKCPIYVSCNDHMFFLSLFSITEVFLFQGYQTVKGLYLDSRTFKLPMPTGEYLLASSWFFNEKPLGDVNISFHYVEDLMA
ncbi:hypothetical protein KR222_000687, partial [Zaprionus bogoriensis]